MVGMGTFERIKSKRIRDENVSARQFYDPRRRLIEYLDVLINRLEVCNLADQRRTPDDVYRCLERVQGIVAQQIPEIDGIGSSARFQKINCRHVNKALDLCYALQHWLFHGRAE